MFKSLVEYGGIIVIIILAAVWYWSLIAILKELVNVLNWVCIELLPRILQAITLLLYPFLFLIVYRATLEICGTPFTSATPWITSLTDLVEVLRTVVIPYSYHWWIFVFSTLMDGLIRNFLSIFLIDQ